MQKEKISIAIKTLNLLKKKSLEEIKIDEIIKNSSEKKLIKSKNDLLKNINRYIDYLLLKNSSDIEKSTHKDMLFEVIMARFDIIQKYRNSFLLLFHTIKFNPKYFLKLLPSFLESMILIASLANVNTNGIKGNVKIKVIFIVYFLTFFDWSKDRTKNLEKTMNSLDNNLNRSEKIFNYIK